MKLYVDLETLQLIEAPGFRTPATSLRFKRGDAATLEVAFLTNSATVYSFIGDEETLAMEFGVKVNAGYAGGYLVHETDWTMPAPEATSPVYVCTPGFNTVELNEAFGVGNPTELASLTLMAEITWREGSGPPTSTRTFTIVVENDVNRGTEGTPESQLGPEAWLSARALRVDAAQVLTHSQRNTAHSNMRDDELLALEMSPCANGGGVSHQQWIRGFHGTFCTATSPSVIVKSSTGYAKVCRWDGTFGAKTPTSGGNPAVAITPGFGTAIATPYNTRTMKGFSVFACDSNGILCSDTVPGYLTYVSIAGLSGVHCAGLAELTYLSLDTGTYSKLDLTNCTKLATLVVNSPALRDLRLPASITTLTSFTLQRWAYNSFDLSYFPNLTTLSVSDCASLVSMNVASNPSLASMTISNCPLYVLSTPTGRTSMTSIVLGNTGISGVFTPASTGVETVASTLGITNQAALTGIDLTGMTGVGTMQCYGNPLQTSFDAGDAAIDTLNISNLPELVTLDVSSAVIGGISISDGKLASINLAGMELNSVNIGFMSLLTGVVFTGTTVTSNFHISTCPLLGALALPAGTPASMTLQGPGITSINFGTASPTSLIVDGTSITSLTVPALLQELSVLSNGSLTSLTVGTQTALINLMVSSNPSLETLDLTGIPVSLSTSVSLTYNYTLYQIVLPTGFIIANSSATLDVSNNYMGSGYLDDLFTALGDVSSYYGVTVAIYGNPGEGSCDPSIATAKYWSVPLTP